MGDFCYLSLQLDCDFRLLGCIFFIPFLFRHCRRFMKVIRVCLVMSIFLDYSTATTKREDRRGPVHNTKTKKTIDPKKKSITQLFIYLSKFVFWNHFLYFLAPVWFTVRKYCFDWDVKTSPIDQMHMDFLRVLRRTIWSLF